MLAWMSQVVSGWLANRYRLFIPFIPLFLFPHLLLE